MTSDPLHDEPTRRRRLAPRAALVVGPDPGLHGVDSCEWSALADFDRSIADYQLVILDLPAVSGELDGDGFQAVLGGALSKERVYSLLHGPGAELVIVGTCGEEMGVTLFLQSHLPMVISPRSERGSSVNRVSEEFEVYLREVDRYTSVLRAGRLPLTNDDWTLESEPLALAAGRDYIGLEFLWAPRRDDHVAAARLGRVVWLPPATKLDAADAIRLLLVENYNVPSGTTPPPDWMEEISLPEADRLEAELQEVERAIADLGKERADLRRGLGRARKFLAVLYEDGDALEVLARDLMRELGARVVDPTTPGEDDGTLEAPGVDGRFVLEIKGSSASIRLRWARQLEDWVSRRRYPDEESEPEDWGGLLVANAHRQQRPDARPPDPYAPNARHYARQHRHCLITTTQLIEALRAKQSGEFDPDTWWIGATAPIGQEPG